MGYIRAGNFKEEKDDPLVFDGNTGHFTPPWYSYNLMKIFLSWEAVRHNMPDKRSDYVCSRRDPCLLANSAALSTNHLFVTSRTI